MALDSQLDLLKQINANLNDISDHGKSEPQQLSDNLNKNSQEKVYESQLAYNSKYNNVKDMHDEVSVPLKNIEDILNNLTTDLKLSLLTTNNINKQSSAGIKQQSGQSDMDDLIDAQNERDKLNRQPILSINDKLDKLTAYFIGGAFLQQLSKQKQAPIKVESESEDSNSSLLGGKGIGGMLGGLGKGFKYWGQNAGDILKGVVTFSLAMVILSATTLGIMKMIELIDIKMDANFLKKLVAFVAVLITTAGMLRILTDATKGLSPVELAKTLGILLVATPLLGAIGVGLTQLISKAGTAIPLPVLLSFASALIIVGGLTAILVRVLGGVNPMGVLMAGAALLAMSVALIPFTFALKILSGVDIDVKKLLMAGAALAVLSAFVIALTFVAPYMALGILALAGMSVAMLLTSLALNALDKATVPDLKKVMAIGLFVAQMSAIMAGLTLALPFIGGGILAMTGMSLAILALGKGLDALAKTQVPSGEKVKAIGETLKAVLGSLSGIKIDKKMLEGFAGLTQGIAGILMVPKELGETSKGIDSLSKSLENFANTFNKFKDYKFKDVLKSMAEGIKELTKASGDLKKLSGNDGLKVLSDGFEAFGKIKLEKLTELFAGPAMNNIIEFAKNGQKLGDAGKGLEKFADSMGRVGDKIGKVNFDQIKNLSESIAKIKGSAGETSGEYKVGDYLYTIVNLLQNEGIVIRSMPGSGGTNLAINTSAGGAQESPTIIRESAQQV